MASSSSSSSSSFSTRAVYSKAGFHPHLVPIPPSPTDPLLTDLEIYALRYQHNPTTAADDDDVDDDDDDDGAHSSNKEPLLLLHGHPQNVSIWHRVAPVLARRAKRDIVLTDLRGYGHSGVPRVRNFVRLGHEGGDADDATQQQPEETVLRARYSKREMGRDMVQVMRHFGYSRFAVVGHDRGGRVAHRMALDNPEAVTRVMTMDIVPTFDLYERTEKSFATAYWHWFFLIQEYPMPEEMIAHSPKTYLDKMVTRFMTQAGDDSTKKTDDDDDNDVTFPPDVLAGYLAMLSSPPRVHAMCEDYRCSAPGGFDLELDGQDRAQGNKVKQPLRALWGARGLNQALFGDAGPIALWQNVCGQEVSGKAYPCGHYMPEEAPEAMVEEILSFFV